MTGPGCRSGKTPYPSKGHARRAVAALAKHGRTQGTPYRCPECDAWHMTSKPAPIPRYAPRRAMAAEDAFAELERMNRERTGKES